jgi:hypothetical protein
MSENTTLERLTVRQQVAERAQDAMDEWTLLEVLGL